MLLLLASSMPGLGEVATREPTSFDWFMLIFYCVLALGVSFLCSMLEASLLTISRARIRLLIEQDRRSGHMLLRMKDGIDRPLAAILTLNTVAHTMGAAGVGAQVLVIFGNTWVAAGSVIITILILVVSEIIPKTLGAVHAKRLADFTAFTVHGIILMTYPIVIVLEMISKMLGGSSAAKVTRDEVRMVAAMGEDAGVLQAAESRVIHHLLRLDEIRVKDVMTPRTVLFALPKEARIADVMREHPTIPFSRIPVYEGTTDHIAGVVMKYELLDAARDGRDDHLVGDLVRPVHVVPDTATVGHALNTFIQRREHLFHVVDEFGGTAGIITLEDAMETLLGVEIVDETDAAVDMRQLAEHRMAQRRADQDWREP
jgi:CBS domain containing-hemolysin-like protein